MDGRKVAKTPRRGFHQKPKTRTPETAKFKSIVHKSPLTHFLNIEQNHFKTNLTLHYFQKTSSIQILKKQHYINFILQSNRKNASRYFFNFSQKSKQKQSKTFHLFKFLFIFKTNHQKTHTNKTFNSDLRNSSFQRTRLRKTSQLSIMLLGS